MYLLSDPASPNDNTRTKNSRIRKVRLMKLIGKWRFWLRVFHKSWLHVHWFTSLKMSNSSLRAFKSRFSASWELRPIAPLLSSVWKFWKDYWEKHSNLPHALYNAQFASYSMPSIQASWIREGCMVHQLAHWHPNTAGWNHALRLLAELLCRGFSIKQRIASFQCFSTLSCWIELLPQALRFT